MAVNIPLFISCIWYTVGVVWLLGLASGKRTVRAQPLGSRIFQLSLVLLGMFLLASQWFRSGWLGARILPVSETLSFVGLGLAAAGCLFSISARIALGSNWSGRATVKEDHELIVIGPYAVARHPIYAGLLLTAVGTAIAIGEARCILGLVLLAVGFLAKIGQEERLMSEAFPLTYPAYRRRVKALIPGIF
jgi:protein-S-isoprenylcysteine O-methyltransferase Ste14